jgi:anti-sigma regulatory factor (Ser/Thr protein kinase)
MSEARVVELTVPGSLAFRDLALRVVMEICSLFGKSELLFDTKVRAGQAGSKRKDVPAHGYDLGDTFTAEFVSAFSEIYNNIPIHAYEGGNDDGNIKLRIAIARDHLTVEITDTGKSFDIHAVPLPESLPTSGMGIHIARSMLDELVYEPGPPNHWRLTKYAPSARKPSQAARVSPAASSDG